MTCIDLNLTVACGQHHFGGLADEYWQNDFLAGHGLFALAAL